MQGKNNTLYILNQISQKGYIHPKNNGVRLYYQKMHHALANFFKTTPINPEEALECMTYLTTISKKTEAFFSLFPRTMLELYDWAVTGDTLTQRQAETNLLYFFSHTAPPTIEQKKQLLSDVLRMPDFSLRRKEISKITDQITNHYSKNQQFNEDPGLGVLVLLSNVLHLVTPHSRPSHSEIAQEKTAFQNCAFLIKEHAPELYEDKWKTNFSNSTHTKRVIPSIKEAIDVYSYKERVSYRARNFSKEWE